MDLSRAEKGDTASVEVYLQPAYLSFSLSQTCYLFIRNVFCLPIIVHAVMGKSEEDVVLAHQNLLTSSITLFLGWPSLASAFLTSKSNNEPQQGRTTFFHLLIPPPTTTVSQEIFSFLGSKNAQDACQTQIPSLFLFRCIFLPLVFIFYLT